MKEDLKTVKGKAYRLIILLVVNCICLCACGVESSFDVRPFKKVFENVLKGDFDSMAELYGQENEAQADIIDSGDVVEQMEEDFFIC